jgi:hypothetical protein
MVLLIGKLADTDMRVVDHSFKVRSKELERKASASKG